VAAASFCRSLQTDVDDLRARLVHPAVKMVEECLLRHFTQAQQLESTILLFGKVPAGHACGLGIEIDHEFVGADFGVRMAVGAADDGSDMCHEFEVILG
jgi:hypothetical protein